MSGLKRPRKTPNTTIDPELKKVLEDYSDERVLYDTIQLKHPSFVGEPLAEGDSYYLVNHTDTVTRSGITFICFPFSVVLPEVGSNQQTLSLALDNTDQLVQKAIEKAQQNPQAIECLYRTYIEGSNSPKVGPIHLQVEGVTIKEQAVTLECTRPDIYKRTFPMGVRYDSKFKGLMI